MCGFICRLDKKTDPSSKCRCEPLSFSHRTFASSAAIYYDDMIDELTDAMSKEIALEIDKEILEQFINGKTYEISVS